jgi:uncharacterized Ntn-hydrolase superfamily protein
MRSAFSRPSTRPLRPVATYSIVAHDRETGEMGVAVQSHWFSVGTVVSFGEAGVGVVATQAFVEPAYGPGGLAMLREGHSAEETLRALLARDPDANVRQVGIVDAKGRAASHTGERAIFAAGSHVGDGYATQANLMDRPTVWGAMARAYESAKGDLAERLLIALEAAEAEGGDIRGKQSAAILVVAPESTGREWIDRRFDLRVEDHAEPLVELRRIVHLKRVYQKLDAGDAALPSGDFATAMRLYREATELVPDEATNGEAPFWVGATLAARGLESEAMPFLRRAQAVDSRWAELILRLPNAGLLPSDEVAKRLADSLRT